MVVEIWIQFNKCMKRAIFDQFLAANTYQKTLVSTAGHQTSSDFKCNFNTGALQICAKL